MLQESLSGMYQQSRNSEGMYGLVDKIVPTKVCVHADLDALRCSTQSGDLSFLLLIYVTLFFSSSYHFLIYNCAVVLWQICRPYQHPGLCRLYAKPLQCVVRALEDCKDQDWKWRLELLM